MKANSKLNGSEHGAPSLAQAKGKALTRKGKRLFHPIRLALTGNMSGPDIGEQLALLEAGEFGLNLLNHGAIPALNLLATNL